MILRKLISGTLAVLVLIASASFTVNLHLCGGQVQSVAFIEKATPCPMEVQTPPCHKELAKRSSCCDDEQLVYEGQDFKIHEPVNLSTVQVAWVIELPLISCLIPEYITAEVQHYSRYKPPILQHDIPVLIQSFLI